MQTEFFKLEILTPVHIGTGDEADPMGYLMRQEEECPACHILDTRAWASDYPDPEELCAKFSGGNIPQMRKFIADNIDPDIYGIRRIRVSDEAIFREYEKNRDDQKSINQLKISPHLSGNGHEPTLPGSSLKGALRTAVIDWLDREQKLELKGSQDQYNKKLEEVLGKISDNAFKQLKISDVQGWADSTFLVEPRELRRKEGKTATPKSKCEVLPSRFQGGEKTAILFGKFAIGNLSQPSDKRLTLPSGKSWSWNELAELINGYFLSRLEKEMDKFYRQPHFAKTLPVAEQLRQLISNAGPGQMFLRVGHYSHVEFVTVTENRPFTRKGKEGTPLPYGTTRTLANGVLPFGWVCITPCEESQYREGASRCEEQNRRVKSRREGNRAAVFQARAAEIAKNEAAKKEAERKQAEEAARQAEEEQRRASLSPFDRSILEVLEADTDPNKKDEAKLFTALKQGKWEGEEARLVAEKIKAEMVDNGKWREKSTKKNPLKDHDHQKTLEVLKFLK